MTTMHQPTQANTQASEKAIANAAPSASESGGSVGQTRVPRAKFCHRLMPALQLAAANGLLRNEPTTRRLLGYDTGNKGSSAFGHNLVEWAYRGLLEAQSTGERRFTYRLTLLGRQSVKAGHPIIRKPLQPAVLLASYLKANPEEELGVDDVAVKFGVTKRQAQRAIKRVVSLGLAVRINVVRAAQASRKEAA